MPRRSLLSAEQRIRLFAVPTTSAEMARHYVLSPDDLLLVRAKRRALHAAAAYHRRTHEDMAPIELGEQLAAVERGSEPSTNPRSDGPGEPAPVKPDGDRPRVVGCRVAADRQGCRCGKVARSHLSAMFGRLAIGMSGVVILRAGERDPGTSAKPRTTPDKIDESAPQGESSETDTWDYRH